jgi:hypothetical protein
MTQSIRIQKGIPIPNVKPRGRCGTSPSKYPWAQMEPGDSFLMPSHVAPNSFWMLTKNASKDGREFKIYKTDNGYRCWRVR